MGSGCSCPVLIFMDGKDISAWSERVGEPKGVRTHRNGLFTSGSGETCEEPKRKERALASQAICFRISSKVPGWCNILLLRMSTTNVQRSGITLCCVPAFTMVTLIFTGPNKADSFGKR